MAISWTLFVGSISFWLGGPRPQGRAANSKIAVLAAAIRGKSLSSAAPLPDGYSALHGFVSRQNAGIAMPGETYPPGPYGVTALSGRRVAASREEKNGSHHEGPRCRRHRRQQRHRACG